MKLTHLLLLVIIAFTAGCYDMKQDDKGRTIKVNRITGEVSVIEGDKIVKLKNEKELLVEQEASKKLAEAKIWPNITLPVVGGANAHLVTKWSNGNFYFQFFVDKNLRGKGSYFARLNIQLYDEASFLLKNIPIQVSTMTGVLGLDTKTIVSMEYSGQEPMSEGTYKEISTWNVSWAGIEH